MKLTTALLSGCVFAATLSAQTAPTVVGIQGADFTTHLSPGDLAIVYGANFTSGPASSVTVAVGGKQAYILPGSITANQLSIEIPVDVPTGSASLVVTVAGAGSAPFTISLDSYAPALILDPSVSGGGRVYNSANVQITAATPARPGDKLFTYAFGLGPATPAVATGITPTAPNPLAAAVTLTVGGLPATVAFAGVLPAAVGTYQINFTVPDGLQGTQPIVLTVAGRSSSPATFPLFGVSSVLSNASFGSPNVVAPGSIVSVFANGIGSTSQSVGFPATTFQGVSVTFNGAPAPLFHLTASQGQIDLLVPYELPTSGSVNLQLKTPTGTALNFPITMAPAVAALYFLADPGTKGRTNVLAQFNNTAWLAMPDATAAALKIPGNCAASNVNAASLCGQPAVPGDYLVLYTTGLGKATPLGDPNGAQLKTGDTPPADGSTLYQTVAKPTVTVGGFPAQVVFSGIAPGFPGLYQIDFQMPVGVTGDDVPVAVSIGSSPADTRSIAIRSK